jgi:hypothetical protein
MPEVQKFLREAWTATEHELAAKRAEELRQEKARQAERAAAALAAASAAAAAQQLRRNAASRENAGPGAAIGAFLGGIAMGFAGCVSCVNNIPRQTDFNLFSGLWYGAIGGAVIGGVVGIVIGQSKD